MEHMAVLSVYMTSEGFIVFVRPLTAINSTPYCHHRCRANLAFVNVATVAKNWRETSHGKIVTNRAEVHSTRCSHCRNSSITIMVESMSCACVISKAPPYHTCTLNPRVWASKKGQRSCKSYNNSCKNSFKPKHWSRNRPFQTGKSLMCVFITVFGATENGAVLQQEWLKMEHFSIQVIQAFEGKASSYAYLSVCRWLFRYNYCIK